MKTGRLIAATSLAILTTILAASPAEAGKHDRKHHSKHAYKHDGYNGHRHDSDGRHYRHQAYRHRAYRPVVVPSYIAVHGARAYDPYYDNRVWSGPHGHYHPVYAFPVAVRPGVIAYAPHTYCNGHLAYRGDVVLDPHAGYVAHDDYYGGRYHWDDRVSGYVAIGGPNFRIGVGF